MLDLFRLRQEIAALEGEIEGQRAAVASLEREVWRLEDCESRNGTHVNAQAVQRAVLQTGDLIRIGQQMVVFSSEEPAYRGLKPEYLADNTRVRRVFGKQPEAGSSQRSPRKLAHLFRLD